MSRAANAGELRLGWIVVVGLGVVVVSFLLVTLVIAAYAFMLGFQAGGAPDQQAVDRFANSVAPWLGPLVSSVLTIAGAFWVARKTAARRVLHGVLVGTVVGVFFLLTSSISGFDTTDLITLAISIVAGWLGGALARRDREP